MGRHDTPPHPHDGELHSTLSDDGGSLAMLDPSRSVIGKACEGPLIMPLLKKTFHTVLLPKMTKDD